MRKALQIAILACAVLGTSVPRYLYAATVAEAQALLKSSDAIKRRAGAQGLADLRSPEGAPALMAALKDKDAYVRTVAARGLGYMHWTAAGPQLAGLLSDDPSIEVRQTAALALRFLNDPSGIPALSKAVKDPAKPVRLTAIASLGSFRSPIALPALTEAAGDKDPEIRRTALFAIGQVGDPSSLALLKGALKDPDAATRANAAQAIANMPAKDGGLSELQDALKDPDPQVRMSAARSLAMRGNRSGFDIALGAANVDNPPVQVLAIETLGYIHDKTAIPMLESLLKSKNGMVKDAAERSLKRIHENPK